MLIDGKIWHRFRLDVMIQPIILLSVLATLDSFYYVAAVPVNIVSVMNDSVLKTGSSPVIPASDAIITDIPVEFAPQFEESASRAILAPSATATRWETATIAEQPTATTSPDGGSGLPSQTWVLPGVFTDLSPFSVRHMPYGSPNIAVVTGIPAVASATSLPHGSPTPHVASEMHPEAVVFTSPELPRPWTNSSSAYRLFFPSGSRNPRNQPQGGSEFYATPLSVQTANNVTLEYSVFFPADFHWVKGGKLPGLYGGHGECSGGNDAKSCFSTRLMWRGEGAGELYLYAPKDKQTSELCQTPPQSVCDESYGLSVGRGSFYFTPGDWTHVSQTVRLNTPGKQDGGFELVVDGRRVIRRDDVLYRDVSSSNSHKGSADGHDDGGDDNGDGGRNGDDDDGGDKNGDGGNNGDDDDGGDGGDNGDDDDGDNGDTGDDGNDPDLGGLLGDLLRRDPPTHEKIDYGIISHWPGAAADMFGNGDFKQSPLLGPQREQVGEGSIGDILNPNIQPVAAALMSTPSTPPTSVEPQDQVESEEDAQGTLGFIGIFFSIFFGGHELSWASPTDQYVYFKDFGMTINS